MELSNLKSLIENSNESKHAIEKAIGLKQGAIRRWFEDEPNRKKCNPSLEALVKLANHFGTSIDFLVGLNPPEDALPEGERELLKTYRNLNATQRIKLNAYAVGMLDA